MKGLAEKQHIYFAYLKKIYIKQKNIVILASLTIFKYILMLKKGVIQ